MVHMKKDIKKHLQHKYESIRNLKLDRENNYISINNRNMKETFIDIFYKDGRRKSHSIYLAL